MPKVKLRVNAVKIFVRLTSSSSAFAPDNPSLLSDEHMQFVKNRIKKAPTLRPPNDELPVHKKSAVLVPLIVVNNLPSFLFTVRSNVLYKHRGEISFPGGSLETKDDEDNAKAALREAHEEIGIKYDNVKVWGELSSTTGRGTVVVPVLGVLKEAVKLNELKIDANEVAEIFTVSVKHLCQSQHHGFTQFRTGYSMPLFFSENGHRIWGLTAIVLHQVLRILVPDYYKPKLKFLRSVD